jgi:hypothetical protein
MRSDALASHRRHAPSPRPGDRSQELPAEEPELRTCPVCHSQFKFFPDIERRADGIPVAIGFVYRCPNPEPIVTDNTGWFTNPFTIPSTSL